MALPPAMNQQQLPGFSTQGTQGMPGMQQGQGGFTQGTPGLSQNPLMQQQHNQMLIKLLQQGGGHQ